MAPPIDQLTAQGYDLQFGTNVLGHYYFTRLILSTLISTAASLPSSDPVGVRIVELGSDAHLLNAFTGAEVIKFETLQDGKDRSALSTTQLYMQSKSGNILVAAARARKMAESGSNIFTASANPGILYPFDRSGDLTSDRTHRIESSAACAHDRQNTRTLSAFPSDSLLTRI